MKPRKCVKGKACSGACVDPNEDCRKTFPPGSQPALKKAVHMIEHIGVNVLSWKVGKTLGPMVSGFLENSYGVPRESSQMLSEALVQAVTAVGLNYKKIKSPEDLVRNLLIESSAAILGKSAHSGAEEFLSSAEGKEMLKSALPLLAGKFTGIGVAFAGSRLPSLSQLSRIVAERSQSDIQKLRGFMNPQMFNASEEKTIEDISQTLTDIFILSLLRSSRLLGQ